MTTGEFGLIARLTADLPRSSDALLGVGDYAAVLDISSLNGASNKDWVLRTAQDNSIAHALYESLGWIVDEGFVIYQLRL